MVCLTYKAALPVKGVDKGGIGVVLFVDLEAQVHAENIMKVPHLIPIYYQACDSSYVM